MGKTYEKFLCVSRLQHRPGPYPLTVDEAGKIVEAA